jgi:2-polyprenyl-3-methyl-5-hydroxy-6-metoxy-1,4-benzoquinol methylase
MDADYTRADHLARESDHYAKAKYDITLRWLGAAEGRRLLNIGCGNGLFNSMAHAAGFRVEACEPDPVALTEAQSSAPSGVLVIRGGVQDAPFAPGADVIVMHDVLEHVADHDNAVRRVASLLEPHGRAILSVPAMPSLFGLHDELLGHHRRYSKPSLRAVLDPVFRVDRIRYFGMSFIPITLAFSKLARRPYPARSTSDLGLTDRLFAELCALESRVRTPIGTSLICDVTLGGLKESPAGGTS